MIRAMIPASLAVAIVLAIASTTNAGCSVTHRSEGFACNAQSDCTGGRLCINGFCVTSVDTDASTVDSPRTASDGSNGECPDTCTSCDLDKNTCIVDCGGANECNQPIVCPQGFSCEITCGEQSCRNGVDCSQGNECTIMCTGAGSCRNVDCGKNRCSVNCSGNGSCRGVDCSASCACDLQCAFNACADGPICPDMPGCDLGTSCTSQFPGCDTCQM